MLRGFPTTLALIGSLATGHPLHGQVLPARIPPGTVAAAPQPIADSLVAREDPGGAVLGAVVLGAIGFAGVAFSHEYEGALWAEALGIGLGAHIGNRGRGRAMATLIASAGVLPAARAVARWIDLPQGGIFIVPVVQVAVAVLAEVGTAGRRGTR